MTQQRSQQHQTPNRSWQRWWNRLTGKHTHSHTLSNTSPEQLPYINELEVVPPFQSTDQKTVTRHTATGVYWIKYAVGTWIEYEPVSEEVAQHFIDQPELLNERHKIVQRSYQHRPYRRPYQRWQRWRNLMTGKHTHQRIIISTHPEHWPYLEQLELVPPFQPNEHEAVMRHSSSGVYWAKYHDDKFSEYEPIADDVAQQLMNQPELLQERRKAFMGVKSVN